MSHRAGHTTHPQRASRSGVHSFSPSQNELKTEHSGHVPKSVRGWPAAGAPGLAAAPARCLRRRLLRLFRLLRLLRLLRRLRRRRRRLRLLLVRAREAVLRGWRSRLLDSSRCGLGSAPGFQPCESKSQNCGSASIKAAPSPGICIPVALVLWGTHWQLIIK
ncbi:uncharacterized protein LOC119864466 isoform X4 [Canis lupus familiaris]|uniref:uncharacterized protein LOC119864466 isoform X4 n=1 Tax=Canis lupus familiaris TaxID=9615 RepID=UPI0018F6C574|nr:uncharacterized protein LOC119864466 isoform X4 [Canis lupus familiaris]